MLVAGILALLPWWDSGYSPADPGLFRRAVTATWVTLIGLALTVPVALLQVRLFRLASPGTGLDFSQRASDEFGSACLPSFLVGFLLSCCLLELLLKRRRGPAAPPDPHHAGMRIQLVAVSGLAALLVTAWNVAAFDTYVRIGNGSIAHSDLARLGSQTHLTSEIREIVLYAQRRLPSGDLVDEPVLEVHFADGTRLEGHRVALVEHFEPLIAALQKNAPAPIPVRREDGPPS